MRILLFTGKRGVEKTSLADSFDLSTELLFGRTSGPHQVAARLDIQ